MKEIVTLKFLDADSGEDAVVIIRADEGRVALALSLVLNGDVEVVLPTRDCESLVNGLQQGILLATRRR